MGCSEGSERCRGGRERLRKASTTKAPRRSEVRRTLEPWLLSIEHIRKAHRNGDFPCTQIHTRHTRLRLPPPLSPSFFRFLSSRVAAEFRLSRQTVEHFDFRLSFCAVNLLIVNTPLRRPNTRLRRLFPSLRRRLITNLTLHK